MAPLAQLIKKRGSVEDIVADLMSTNKATSADAGVEILSTSKDAGLSMRSYLNLMVDPNKGEFMAKVSDTKVSGYEATLAYLNLPVANDFNNGIVLEAAGDTFVTYPGTRALFPEVINDVVQWKYRQDQFVNIEPMLANSRSISGPELLSTVVNDTAADYQFTTPIAEGSRAPMRSIKTGEGTVKIWKHGSGIKFTYEFQRRARLDLFTPYLNRIERESQISRVNTATDLLINGVGTAPAAAVVNQSALATGTTAGIISYKALISWLVKRAQVGTPIDTVVGNWDSYIQWLMMFSVPDIGSGGVTAQEALSKANTTISTRLPLLNFNVDFIIGPNMPANKLIGYSRGDTLEELKEEGSDIQETDRLIRNQTVEIIQTTNTGYRLVFEDTREILNFGA